MARELLPRSYEVTAVLQATGTKKQAEADSDYVVERLMDMDGVPIGNATIIANTGKKITIRFELEEDEGPPTKTNAEEYVGYACENVDLDLVSVSVGTEPLPYDEDEQDENAERQKAWAEVDLLWPTLSPGDYVRLNWGGQYRPGAYVVERVVDDGLVLRRHCTDQGNTRFVFEGDEDRVERLDINELYRDDPFCSHGHDARLPQQCADCALRMRMFFDGMRRDVL